MIFSTHSHLRRFKLYLSLLLLLQCLFYFCNDVIAISNLAHKTLKLMSIKNEATNQLDHEDFMFFIIYIYILYYYNRLFM